MTQNPVEMFCETCGSDDIGIDACAHWNVITQEWEFTSTYDQTWCSTCGSEMIGERPAPPHVRPVSGFRCEQNRYFNQGFYIRPDDGLNWAPLDTYPTEAAAWTAFHLSRV